MTSIPTTAPVLTGKVALVTGSGQGIGLAAARALARAGARLAVNDLSAPAAEAAAGEIVRAGAEALAVPADVSDPAQVESAVNAALAHFGRIDILVNNAGIGGSGKLCVELELGEWERMIAVDLTSVFLCCRAVLPGMMARRSGKIINLSSVFGLAGAAGSVPYSAAKAGVIGLTRALAREVASQGINVNAVAPGLVETAMSRARGTLASMRAQVPWPRLGQPEDIAELIVFLAAPASDYITGQVISANGGSHI